jgi:hypothetical protein
MVICHADECAIIQHRDQDEHQHRHLEEVWRQWVIRAELDRLKRKHRHKEEAHQLQRAGDAAGTTESRIHSRSSCQLPAATLLHHVQNNHWYTSRCSNMYLITVCQTQAKQLGKHSRASPVVDEVLHAGKDCTADLNGMHNHRQTLLQWQSAAGRRAPEGKTSAADKVV